MKRLGRDIYVVTRIFIAMLSAVGYVIMWMRYGKNHKEILNEKFEGFYSGVGAKFLRMLLIVLFLLFLILIVLIAILIMSGI